MLECSKNTFFFDIFGIVAASLFSSCLYEAPLSKCNLIGRLDQFFFFTLHKPWTGII